MGDAAVIYERCGSATDDEINALHQAAFGHAGESRWNDELLPHSVTWISARLDGRLVGFVNVIGDGGVHAILLDTAVLPPCQGQGIGRRLVAEAADAAACLGCRWLHTDYKPHLTSFYESACGLHPTHAGLLELPDSG